MMFWALFQDKEMFFCIQLFAFENFQTSCNCINKPNLLKALVEYLVFMISTLIHEKLVLFNK